MQSTGAPAPVAPAFDVKSVACGTTFTVTVCGDLDLTAAEQLTAAIDGALALTPDIVAVDLAGVTFIDSSGLHVLVTAHRRAAARDVTLVLLPGPPQVQRVFALCGLLDVLPLRDVARVPPASALTRA